MPNAGGRPLGLIWNHFERHKYKKTWQGKCKACDGPPILAKEQELLKHLATCEGVAPDVREASKMGISVFGGGYLCLCFLEKWGRGCDIPFNRDLVDTTGQPHTIAHMVPQVLQVLATITVECKGQVCGLVARPFSFTLLFYFDVLLRVFFLCLLNVLGTFYFLV